MADLAYLNFDLLIEPSGETYRARVSDSPTGDAAKAGFDFRFSEADLKALVSQAGRARGSKRDVVIDHPAESSSIKDFGQRLFEAVFTGEIYLCLRRSLDEAGRQGAGLRIRLILEDVPQLIDLPWEYLYDPMQRRFLGTSKQTPVVRYLRLSEPRRPISVKAPLRMLVMISSPKGHPQLDTEREWEKLSTALDKLVDDGLVTLTRLETATLLALQQELDRETYHVLHYIGHGGFDRANQGGVLFLEDDARRATPIAADLLGTMVYDHDSMRLVVLNSCEGARTSLADPFAGTAQTLIQQRIPAVVAMQFPITDEAAVDFAHGLYQALAGGYPVDAAMAHGRIAILAQGNQVEWATPVLYMRSPDGRIFDIAPTGASAPEPPPTADAETVVRATEPSTPEADGPPLQRARRTWALAMAEPDNDKAAERKTEAYELLREAQQADPMDTEVLLLMAELLIELTPDDPTDERKLLQAARRLLEQPKDDAERARLAQASYLLAASHDPLDVAGLEEVHELLGQARTIFEQLGRADMVARCDALLGQGLDRAMAGLLGEEGGAAELAGLMGLATESESPPDPGGSASPAPQSMPGPFPGLAVDAGATGGAAGTGHPAPPAPPMAAGPKIQSAVQLAGRWQLQSPFGVSALLELRPDGFQSQVFRMGVMTNVQAGYWVFHPANQTLMLQGMDNGVQFFTALFSFVGQEGNGYAVVDPTGARYSLTRAA